MRVALNATPLLSPFTGIGQYTYHLAKGLQARHEIDLNLFYGLGWSKVVREKSVQGIVPVKAAAKKLIPNLYAINRAIQQFRFSSGIKRCKPDIYHEPNVLAFKSNYPTVVTVHDLSWMHYPEMHPVDRVKAMNKYFEQGIRRAKIIITDSEFVKTELVDLFGLDPAYVKAIPLGVDELFHPRRQDELVPVLQQHELSYRSYIITVGTLEPRKNLKSVIEAYKSLPVSVKKNFPLVVVGMNGWHTSSIQKLIEPLVRSGELKQIGYLPRKELAELIAGAGMMVYPSVYEGFGLPPLEAMASGTPIIASGVSSLPEVVGDAGISVNPEDVNQIRDAIEKIALDENELALYAQRGYERSKNFTWDECVSQTISCYRDALSG